MGRGKKATQMKIEVRTESGEFREIGTEFMARLLEENPRDYIINNAEIKDGYCNYSWEITKEGVIGLGDKLSTKGSNVVKDDMRKAFANLNVHLAIIDDVFKHAGIEFETPAEVKVHDLALDYKVISFEISGSDDDEKIKLVGEKRIRYSNERMVVKTPKMPLNPTSSYPWSEELKNLSDLCRYEVAEYKEGKYEEPEVEEEVKEKKSRKKMQILPPAGEEKAETGTDHSEGEEGSEDDDHLSTGKM